MSFFVCRLSGRLKASPGEMVAACERHALTTVL